MRERPDENDVNSYPLGYVRFLQPSMCPLPCHTLIVHFLISVIDSESNSGSDAEMAAIDAFNDMLRANGHWFYANGLHAPSSATVIDNRDGSGRVSPGPLFVADENVSGMWIIEAPSHEVALRLATEASCACNRKVELRPFHG